MNTIDAIAREMGLIRCKDKASQQQQASRVQPVTDVSTQRQGPIEKPSFASQPLQQRVDRDIVEGAVENGHVVASRFTDSTNARH